MLFFDYRYFLFMIPGILFMLWAQNKVKGTYAKYSQIRDDRGLTGAQAAREILDANGLQDVQIQPIAGELTDHYDPRNRVLSLSQGVYGVPSIAAIGIAAHESGHALQHAQGYAPLKARTAIVPAVNIGTNAAWIFIVIGLLIQQIGLAWVGVGLFALSTVFALVTLPVEFDASHRAKQQLVRLGLVDGGVRGQAEAKGVAKVLDAAAWTYIAGFAVSVLQLLYWITVVSGSGGRRRN